MGDLDQEIIVVTGAAGFLGKRVVETATRKGHRVRAVVRSAEKLRNIPCLSDDNVEVIEMDLAIESADFSRFLGVENTSYPPATVVVHAAGLLTGTREQQTRATIEPTRLLLQAMGIAGCKRLVHISSMSVYGYAAIPDGGQIDELTPVESNLDDRDEYCRSKIEQENIIKHCAQQGGVQATILRPGFICGYERRWTARLGVKKAGLLLQFNRHARLPLSFVEHCAEAVVLAACRIDCISDVYLTPGLVNKKCGFEIINVLEDAQPTQERYLSLMHDKGFRSFRFRVCVPWRLSRVAIKAISMPQIILPVMYKYVPKFFRQATFDARMKDIRYSNARLKERLGWRPEADGLDATASSWVQVQNK
jgi:nucleoside-diphosphate-sugar epimerase